MHRIDPQELYRVSEVPHLTPGSPNVATVWRWILTGVGVGRDRHRLESKKVGGRRFVTGQAILDFIEWDASTEPVRGPAQQQADDAAGRRLDEIGV